jgi:hypothetical protein
MGVLWLSTFLLRVDPGYFGLGQLFERGKKMEDGLGRQTRRTGTRRFQELTGRRLIASAIQEPRRYLLQRFNPERVFVQAGN